MTEARRGGRGRRGARVLLLAALVGLGGCAVGWQEHGRIIDPRKVALIEIGESTKQDVLDMFGPPTNLTRAVNPRLPWDLAAEPGVGGEAAALAPEDVYTYEYVENRERFFTLLLYTYWSRSALADTLLVVFDAEGRVKYLAFAKQTDAEVEGEE